MKYDFRKIAGLNELINELSKQGIYVTELDLSIADALMHMTPNNVIRDSEDMDGYEKSWVDAVIYDAYVDQTLKKFPNVVSLISCLDNKKNDGFINEKGEKNRVSSINSIDPIYELRALVGAYTGNMNIRLFDSKKDYFDYKIEQIRGRNPYSELGGPEYAQYNLPVGRRR